MKPETEQLNRDLELALFGDDLTCKTDEQIVHLASNSYSADWCLGDGQLIQYTIPPETHHTEILLGPLTPAFRDHRGSIITWLWEHRIGKKWQDQLEQHVAAYRRVPRDFTTPDGMMLVLKGMSERGFFVTISVGRVAFTDYPNCRYTLAQVNGPEKDYSNFPELVARAALAAIPRAAALLPTMASITPQPERSPTP